METNEKKLKCKDIELLIKKSTYQRHRKQSQKRYKT